MNTKKVKLETLEALHTHTHTGSLEVYLTYNNIKENIKTHELYISFALSCKINIGRLCLLCCH